MADGWWSRSTWSCRGRRLRGMHACSHACSQAYVCVCSGITSVMCDAPVMAFDAKWAVSERARNSRANTAEHSAHTKQTCVRGCRARLRALNAHIHNTHTHAHSRTHTEIDRPRLLSNYVIIYVCVCVHYYYTQHAFVYLTHTLTHQHLHTHTHTQIHGTTCKRHSTRVRSPYGLL